MVQLTVLEPLEKPVFHDPASEKITAMAGHTISLNCSATGTPTPALLWALPNGTERGSGQRLAQVLPQGGRPVARQRPRPQDAGAYRCVGLCVGQRGPHGEAGVPEGGLKPETKSATTTWSASSMGRPCGCLCVPPGFLGRASWDVHAAQRRGAGCPQVRDARPLGERPSPCRDAPVFDRGTYAATRTVNTASSVVSVPVIGHRHPPRITSEPTPVIYARPAAPGEDELHGHGYPQSRDKLGAAGQVSFTRGRSRLYGKARFLHPQGPNRPAGHPERRWILQMHCENLLGSDSKTTYVHIY